MISMVGKPTDIIAFRMSDNEHQTGEGCHCYPNDPIWLHTRGVLRSATPSHNDPLTNPAATIQLSIEINNWWEPLNPIFWAWESEPFAYYNTTLAPEYVTPELVSEMPSAQDVLDRKKKWVRKVFDYPQFIYNPDGWENEFCDECGNLANGKASSWMQGNAWKETRGMPLTWNAPMRSMWAFKNLSGKSGVIEIKTVSGVAWEREDSTTTINLAQLNDDLLSRGVQIEDDDILMIGDVSHRPGFIMKREEVSGGRYLYLEVPNFTPIVNYARFWPGQLSVGNNRFMVITPSGVLYAYRHTYRSM